MFDDALDFPCVLMKLFEFSISEISNWGGGARGYMWGVGGLGKEVELFLLDLMFRIKYL